MTSNDSEIDDSLTEEEQSNEESVKLDLDGVATAAGISFLCLVVSIYFADMNSGST